jgi:hypothetical protein
MKLTRGHTAHGRQKTYTSYLSVVKRLLSSGQERLSDTVSSQFSLSLTIRIQKLQINIVQAKSRKDKKGDREALK